MSSRSYNTKQSSRTKSSYRSRSRSPLAQASHRQNGDSGSESSHRDRGNRQSSYTALKQSRRARTTPIEVFTRHRAANNVDIQYCGFYWHSTRLARAGTDWIFNEGKQKFQERMNNNVIKWEDCRELLFDFKKCQDQKYRNIMYHLSRGGHCHKCEYWGNMYLQHLAQVETEQTQPEVSDQKMLEMAMQLDGTNK
ncbi:NP1 protein [Bat bocavirus]|uniref:NP1 protein n=1 Tax=Bat bocavirus TaxID=1329649 RepID=UPI00076F2CDB|nr:NP1 protein [Bat bocavirus]AMD43873.1 NP1 protein [Bat bocavirus]